MRAASGRRPPSHNPLAKKWADNMTAHYDELVDQGDDLRPVAQLHGPGRRGGADLDTSNLTEKCGWSMPLLLNPDLKAQRYHAPHEVAS